MTKPSGEQAKAERETTVRWDDHRDVVSLFTASPVVNRKLRRAGYTPSRVSTVKGVESGWFYRIPYADLRWTARVRKIQPIDRDRARAAGMARAVGARAGGRFLKATDTSSTDAAGQPAPPAAPPAV